MPAFASDAVGRLTWFNQTAVEFWGERPELGRPWSSCFHRIVRPNGAWIAPEEFPTAAAVAANRPVRGVEMVFERPDHTRMWFVPQAAPLADGGPEPCGAITLLTDVSERRAAEDTQEFMFRELKHRMKNTLTTIQAIARQTFRDVPAAEREMFAARLRALGEVHELLLRDQDGRTTLDEVLSKALAPFQSSLGRRFAISGPPATLSANDCLLLSMVVHELATNAVKYGALSGKGRVEIFWKTRGRGKKLLFRWVESGGPPVHAPVRRSFGTALIERAFRSPAAAGLQFLPGGVRCEFEIPL